MRYVHHGTPPEFLRGMPNEFDRVFGDWDQMFKCEKHCRSNNNDLCAKIKTLRGTLKELCGARKGTGSSHGPICTYCELVTAPGPLRAEIEHFRPRKHDCARYSALEFMWENLVYVCKRCNDIKTNKFPHSIGGYISPTDPRCHSYFGYDFDTLKICAAENVCNDSLKARIERTICDFKLNRQYLIDRRGDKKRDINREVTPKSASGGLTKLTREGKGKAFKEFVRRDPELFGFALSYAMHKKLLTSDDRTFLLKRVFGSSVAC